MAFKISTNEDKFFAEIFGVDLSTSLSSTEKADLLEAAHENAVLLFLKSKFKMRTTSQYVASIWED